MTEPVRPPSQDELDPVEIAALQLTRLQATLRRAYDKVPHYERCFDEAGASPADLTSLDDLARFPFAVKDDPRLNYPFDMFAVPREQVMRIHASSGTAGTPTVVGYTSNDFDMWAGLVARCLRAAGARAGDTARSMRRMQRVTGRDDDMLIIRDVNLFPSFIEEIGLKDERLSPHHYLEVRRPGRLDELTVVVEAEAGAADDKTRRAAGRDLAGRIKSQVGINSEVSVGGPGSIERFIGKAKRIVDLRPKE